MTVINPYANKLSSILTLTPAFICCNIDLDILFMRRLNGLPIVIPLLLSYSDFYVFLPLFRLIRPSLSRFGERELVIGKFKQVLDGCSRGLNLPLTLHDNSPLLNSTSTVAQKTLVALIWDLGGDPLRVKAAKAALRVYCSLLANGKWAVDLPLNKRKSTGGTGAGAGAGAGAAMSPTNDSAITIMNENIAIVLRGAFNFFVWHLAQLKFKEKPHCEQEQSVRLVLELVGLLKQEDLSKFLPKIMMVRNISYRSDQHLPTYLLTYLVTHLLTLSHTFFYLLILSNNTNCTLPPPL